MGGLAGHMARVGADLTVKQMLELMPWRGPDGHAVTAIPGGAFGHLALAGNSVAADQPLVSADGKRWLVMNGALTNGTALRALQRGPLAAPPLSDAAILLNLFEQEGPNMLHRLHGMYAVAIYGQDEGLFLARDPLGVKPLYYGFDAGGQIAFASEQKALLSVTADIREFPPGCYYQSGAAITPFFHWTLATDRPGAVGAKVAVPLARSAIEHAVGHCLDTDAAVGVCLSGGLDSSLVAAMARQHQAARIKSFAVGMVGSSDLEWARAVADYLETDHYEYAYTPDEVISVLPEVIYHLESFDPPLVRSAVATWMCGRLAAEHVEVVLTGEGADELFAGYHYLKEIAPDEGALSEELLRITRGVHNSNLQRADREMMAHGVEARLPLLEQQVLDVAFTTDPAIMLGPDGTVEKWVLRKVAEPYLPADVVWRRKEKFSLGTGTGQFLADYAKAEVADHELVAALPGGGALELHSKEEALYWRHFAPHFGRPAILQAMGRSPTVGDFDRNPALGA